METSSYTRKQMTPPCKYGKDWFVFISEENLKTLTWKWVISQLSLFLGLQSCLFYMSFCCRARRCHEPIRFPDDTVRVDTHLSCVYPVSSHRVQAQTFYTLAIIEMPLSFIPFVLWVLLWKPPLEKHFSMIHLCLPPVSAQASFLIISKLWIFNRYSP